MITEFFGVTSHYGDEKPKSVSVYRVHLDDDGKVVMEKIALKGPSSIKVGGLVGANGASYQGTLGVSYDFGLQRYEQLGRKRVDEVNTISWGGGTTPIVGLFSDRKSALKCFRTAELKHWDERFLDNSMDIIRNIGPGRENRINLDGTLARAVENNQLRELLLNDRR